MSPPVVRLLFSRYERLGVSQRSPGKRSYHHGNPIDCWNSGEGGVSTASLGTSGVTGGFGMANEESLELKTSIRGNTRDQIEQIHVSRRSPLAF